MISPRNSDISHRRAVIVYRIQRMRIRIVRIFYGGQDYATLMDF